MANNSKAFGGNFNNKASVQQAVIKSIKSNLNSFYGAKVNADEAKENRIRFLIKPTQEQYEQIKALLENPDDYYVETYTGSFLCDFEFTPDQVLELSKITSNSTIALRLLENLENPNLKYLDQIVDILKKFPEDVSAFCIFDNMFEKQSLTCTTFEEFNNLKEKLENSLRELIVFEDEKIQEKNRMEFTVSTITKLLRVVSANGIEIPKDFIFKNNDIVPIEFLFKAYTDASDDPLSCERLKDCIKKNCERKIRREFGPCADLVKITINWDLDSMILFNKMNDDNDDKEWDEDCERGSF